MVRFQMDFKTCNVIPENKYFLPINFYFWPCANHKKPPLFPHITSLKTNILYITLKNHFKITFTKLSGKRPRFPLRSPSIHPSSSIRRTFLITSPSLRVNSSSWRASYSYSTTTSTAKKGTHFSQSETNAVIKHLWHAGGEAQIHKCT